MKGLVLGMNKEKLIEDLEEMIDKLHDRMSVSDGHEIQYMCKDEIFDYVYYKAERAALQMIEVNVKEGKYD